VDGSDKKLELAKSFGADYTINRLKTINISERIKDYTDGIGSDIVVDATGNENALKDIIASCRTRGKIHIKSTHGLEVPLNITDIVVREITIYTSRCGPFEKAIKGLHSGEIEVKSLISAEYNLEEIQTAFEFYGKDRDQIKTIINME
jgi:alcohol dehydrogenase